jgi:hypothetical protein
MKGIKKERIISMALSNKEIENMAIEVVVRFEKSKNRNPQDIRRKQLSYDVSSSGRIIEVKGIEKALGDSGNWRFVQQNTVQLLLTENNFYIYIVDNLSKGINNAHIYILDRKEALPFLKIKPTISFSLHIPASQREKFRKK